MKNIDTVLKEMSFILEGASSCQEWRKKLISITGNKLDPRDLRYEIRSMYGGAGSLNDVVICDKDGNMDRDINVKFDKLRCELYELSQSL